MSDENEAYHMLSTTLTRPSVMEGEEIVEIALVVTALELVLALVRVVAVYRKGARHRRAFAKRLGKRYCNEHRLNAIPSDLFDQHFPEPMCCFL